MCSGGNPGRLRHSYDEGRSPAEKAAEKHDSGEEHKDKAQARNARFLATIGPAKIQDRQSGALFARKQLGLHHVMGSCVARFI